MSADNTPDFDSMSPEELMAWMETLAERQGAVEGFTTESRMEIDEVDPDSVQVEDNYIPYGMTEEDWAKKKAEEEAAKAARRAERDTAKAQPPAAELPPMPEATGAVPEPPSLDLPSLDDFSEETEIAGATAGGDGSLDWLNDLAADQGLGEDLPDLSALGQELGDLDLGGDLDQLSLGDLESLTAEPEAETPQAEAADPMNWLEDLAAGQGVSMDDEEEDEYEEDELPVDVQSPISPRRPEPAQSGVSDPESEDVDPLEWLESLAKQQGADEDELITDASVDVPQAGTAADDVPGYTDYSVEEDDRVPSTVDTLDTEVSGDPDDPVAWLDSLASAQNEDASPQLDFLDDTPQAAVDDEVGDEDEDEVEELTEGIMDRLNRAEDVSPEEMGNWFANLLDKGAERDDVSDYIEDEDEEDVAPVEAQIPDWLVEQVGPPPDLQATSQPQPTQAELSEPKTQELDLDEILGDEAAAEAEAAMMDWLEEAVDEAAADDVEIPDWLQDEETAASAEENIFADAPDTTPTTPEPEKLSTMELDTSDPWVEAFEMERREGLTDPDNIPEWYEARLSGEAAPSGVSAAARADALQPANLPAEAELAAGELEAMPSWLDGEAAAAPAFTAPAEASWIEETQETDEEVEIPDWLQQTETEAVDQIEMPSWLQEADIQPDETIPDWLIDTMEEGEAPAFVPHDTSEQPVKSPAPKPTPAIVPQASSPAPPVPIPANFDVAATLESARQRMSSGDVPESLADYEMIVRVNAQLDVVVKDLSDQVKGKQKENAAVYRVLGDGLMRQGRLQEALDTYRKALNLL